MMGEPARTFTVREACESLGIGQAEMRAWIAAWESLAGELPRVPGRNRHNAPRLIPAETLDRLREARSMADEHDGRLGVFLAVRRVLGKETHPADVPSRASGDGSDVVLSRLECVERPLSEERLAALVASALHDELGHWEASQESVDAIRAAVEEAVAPLRAQVDLLTVEHQRLIAGLTELRRHNDLPLPREWEAPAEQPATYRLIARFLRRR